RTARHRLLVRSGPSRERRRAWTRSASQAQAPGGSWSGAGPPGSTRSRRKAPIPTDVHGENGSPTPEPCPPVPTMRSVTGRVLPRVPLHERPHDAHGLRDLDGRTALDDLVGLLGREVAVVAVDLDTGRDPVRVELGVELRRVLVPADAEHLHRAP